MQNTAFSFVLCSVEKMTTTNNTFNVGLFLSALCLVIVFVGGWYFQSSIVELRTMVANQQEEIMEQKKEIIAQRSEILEQKKETAKQKKEILEQRNEMAEQKKEMLQQMSKIVKQEETNHLLKGKLSEQNRKLDKLLLQQQLEKSQFQVSTKD